MKNDMPFGVAYLSTIDAETNVGTVNICVVMTVTQTLTLNLKLMFHFHTPAKTLHSPTAANYIVEYWMNRIGLWASPLMEITQQALNARIFTSNQGVEGTFNYEKNQVSTFNEDTADIASLVNRRSQDNIENGRMLRCQIGESRLVISARKRRKAKVKKFAPSHNTEMKRSSVPSHETSCIHNEESSNNEDLGMQWRGNSKTTKAELNRWKAKMDTALSLARELGMIDSRYNEKVRRSKWRVMDSYARTIDQSFMSYQIFNKWMAGKRTTPLMKPWRDIINKFAEDAGSADKGKGKKKIAMGAERRHAIDKDRSRKEEPNVSSHPRTSRGSWVWKRCSFANMLPKTSKIHK